MRKIIKNNKIWALLLLVVFFTSIIAPFTFAGPGMQKGKIAGVVQNIDYSKKTFNLKSAEKEFNVIYTVETIFIKDGKKVAPEDLKNDNKVLVSGPLADDGKTVNAHQIVWGEIPQMGKNQPPVIRGTIKNLNLTDSKFDLILKDKDGNEITFNVIYTANTKFIRDMKPSKPEEFKNDELVNVMGKINPDEKKIEALLVCFGKMPDMGNRGKEKEKPAVNGITGKVGEINLEQKQFTLVFPKQDPLIVKFYDWTNFIKNKNFVFPSELKKDDVVEVLGPVNKETRTIEAHYVVWGRTDNRKNQPPVIRGTIKNLNLTDSKFDLILKDKDGNEITFNVIYTANTKFIRDMKPSKPEEFKNDELVNVMGKINPDEKKIEALLVCFGKMPNR